MKAYIKDLTEAEKNENRKNYIKSVRINDYNVDFISTKVENFLIEDWEDIMEYALAEQSKSILESLGILKLLSKQSYFPKTIKETGRIKEEYSNTFFKNFISFFNTTSYPEAIVKKFKDTIKECLKKNHHLFNISSKELFLDLNNNDCIHIDFEFVAAHPELHLTEEEKLFLIVKDS